MIEKILSLLRDPEAMERMRSLARIPLFGGLEDKALALISPCLQEHLYLKGETVFKEGDIGRALFIVKSGKIEIYKTLEGGGRAHLRDIGAGGFFGEMALLYDGARSATAEAAEDSTALLLHKSRLSALMQDSPVIGMRIYGQFARVLAERLNEAENRPG